MALTVFSYGLEANQFSGVSDTESNASGFSIFTATQTPSATGKHNGFKATLTQSAAGDDSNAAFRGLITKTTTAAIGNLRTGQFALDLQSVPTSQGHTAAVYAEVSLAGAGNNATGVISAVKNSAASIGLATPFLNIIDAGVGKTTIVMEMGTGGALGTAAGDSSTAAFTTGATVATLAAATSCALRVKINGTVYFIPVATAV